MVGKGVRGRNYLTPQRQCKGVGLDHGIGHSLLLLYDVKAPNGQKSKEFKGLGHYPSSTSLGLF